MRIGLHIAVVLTYVMQAMTCVNPTVEVGKKYVDEFNEIFGTKYWIPVMYKNLEGSIVGTCSTSEVGDIIFNRSILIDPVAWGWYDDISRRHLMFHELAHCAFSAEHNDEKDENGCSLDVMSPWVPNRNCVTQELWNIRLERLIKRFKK